MMNNGETDTIRQERLRGLQNYYQSIPYLPPRRDADYIKSVFGKSAGICGKQCLSGGGCISNIQMERGNHSPETEMALINEQYQDYSKMSAEDAAGRIGNDYDGIDYGWSSQRGNEADPYATPGGPPRPNMNWSGEQLYREYHGDLCRGDQKLAEKMKDVGMRAQQSIINRAAFHRNSVEHLYKEELSNNENNDWWDDDEALEQYMTKDGIPASRYYAQQ
jgi:hypothetical protein